MNRLGGLLPGGFNGIGTLSISGPLTADLGDTAAGVSQVKRELPRRVTVVRDDCRKRYPNPRIRFDRKDAEGQVYIPVINWTSYDNAMFRKAPDLPPCGANTNSSRTWVDILRCSNKQPYLRILCIRKKDDLKTIWF